MGCPYCQGDATQVQERTTALGYRLFRCRPCRRTFNERTGTHCLTGKVTQGELLPDMKRGRTHAPRAAGWRDTV